MRFVALLATLALPAAVLAQAISPDTARIAPIVVTATRAPLGQRELPVAVTIIRGEDLRLRGVTSVAEALTDVSSAYVAQSGSAGAQTSLFLRGGESKYVKVLIDGVPVNDPGGAYDFASLTTDNVERIEVVRGPASVVYGADAVTGVVNVITRRGTAAARTDLDLAVGGAPRERSGNAARGMMHTLDADARTSGAFSAGGGDFTLGLARHQSSGLYQLNNAYGNNVFSARAAFAPDQRTSVRLALHYTDFRYNYPTNSAGAAVDSNAFKTQDRTVVGVDVGRTLGARAAATLSLGSSMNDGGTNDALDDPSGSSYVSQDKIRRRNAEVRLQLTPAASSIVTLGVQTEQEDEQSQSQGSFGGFPFTSLFDAARRNTAGYGELVTTVFERVTATVGARLDDNERFGQFFTGRAGLSWRVLPNTRLRATTGNAFREPSFFENYASGYVVGNPGLAPEHTRSADAVAESCNRPPRTS
jgi:vitamin B12 transporter